MAQATVPIRLSTPNCSAGTSTRPAMIDMNARMTGSAWHSVSHYVSVGGYVIVALVVLAIVGLIGYRLREVRREAAAAGQTGGRHASSR
jgi:hypothetical protein